MVAQNIDMYSVKTRGKTLTISKPELKQKNLDWIAEYKTANPERRGRIMSDYYDYNKPFLTYFPKFHGSYRDEIVHIMIASLPKAFIKFDPARGIDVNSYISMYYKKAAVKEFLYLLPTVMFNRFEKDKRTGRVTVLKAHCVSLDHFNGSGDQNSEGEDLEPSSYLQETVTDYHLRKNSSNVADAKDGMVEMHHHFTGIARECVRDFEDGLRWNEVREKHNITPAKFLVLMDAIRMRLKRIMKENGRDARFIARNERKALREARRRRYESRIHRATSGAVLAGEGFGEDYIQDERDTPPPASLAIDKLWGGDETTEEEDG